MLYGSTNSLKCNFEGLKIAIFDDPALAITNPTETIPFWTCRKGVTTGRKELYQLSMW